MLISGVVAFLFYRWIMNRTNHSKQERSVKELFIGKCWNFLSNNFHKFSQENKIKIALELCKKDIPQEFNGTMTGPAPIVVVIPKERQEEYANRLKNIPVGW